jgi:hypothetical protein
MIKASNGATVRGGEREASDQNDHLKTCIPHNDTENYIDIAVDGSEPHAEYASGSSAIEQSSNVPQFPS